MNATSSCTATVTPSPGVACVVAPSVRLVRSSTLILPVLRSRRITNRSLWVTCMVWPCASVIFVRVSTLPVTPLTRATSPLSLLHSQELTS